jgi:RHS repeat-associated protein
MIDRRVNVAPMMDWTDDAAGNAQAYGSYAFGYNNRGRMMATNAGSTNYLYNALGQMIEKSGTAGTTIFMQDESGHLIGEYDGSGNLIEETIWLGDIPVATLQFGTSALKTYYVHTDHLNTPRRITNRNTNIIVWRWDSDPFGNGAAVQNPQGSVTVSYNLRFPGQYYMAETGLNYNYFRDYDPAVGRYIESDPVGLGGGINTYAYGGDSPVWFFDPYGLRVLNPNGYPVSPDVMNALWDFNRLIGCSKDIVITGGNRPPSSKLGAGSNSTHAQGIAADITVPGQLNLVTANEAVQSGLFGGVGWYEEGYRGPNGEGPHTHVDLRKNGPARWGFPAKGSPTHGYFPKYEVELNPNNCGCEQ